MGKINCRGHLNRVNLCKIYDIMPAFRVKLLKGIFSSDAGGKITDELYIFSAYDKETGEYYDKITCGEPTARDFLLITGEKRPELFNMLKPVKKTTSTSEKRSTEKKISEKKTSAPNVQTDTINWHPVNRALYEGIMVLILVWQDTNGDSLLFRELRKCIKYPDRYPFPDRLIRFNSIVSKDHRKTLANILKSLETAGNDLKDFDLEILHDAVLRAGVKSYIM